MAKFTRAFDSEKEINFTLENNWVVGFGTTEAGLNDVDLTAEIDGLTLVKEEEDSNWSIKLQTGKFKPVHPLQMPSGSTLTLKVSGDHAGKEIIIFTREI